MPQYLIEVLTALAIGIIILLLIRLYTKESGVIDAIEDVLADDAEVETVAPDPAPGEAS